jgi:hypothetical protein
MGAGLLRPPAGSTPAPAPAAPANSRDSSAAAALSPAPSSGSSTASAPSPPAGRALMSCESTTKLATTPTAHAAASSGLEDSGPTTCSCPAAFCARGGCGVHLGRPSYAEVVVSSPADSQGDWHFVSRRRCSSPSAVICRPAASMRAALPAWLRAHCFRCLARGHHVAPAGIQSDA